MLPRRISHFLAPCLAPCLALALAPLADAQGVDCASATPILPGSSTPFSTVGALSTAPAFTCGGATGSVWFTYTMTSDDVVSFDTCGSSYDTVLDVWYGACGTLTLAACNDDFCGLQSEVRGTGVAGLTLFIRVGGYNGATGQGVLNFQTFSQPQPPAPECVQTLFGVNVIGGLNGAVYFDLSLATDVTLAGMWTNFITPTGTPCGLLVYTTPTTYVGKTNNAAAWTLVAQDDGTTLCAGTDSPTVISFLSPLQLTAGAHGVALVAVNARHAYTGITDSRPRT
jgi:hypothetical protein